LLRILQTLGAYGFRGLIEKKPHFISSIQPALIQLNAFIQSWPHILNYNELRKILFELVKPEVIAKFGALDTEPGNDILKIKIYSFSYKKGLPAKEDENGGGFVFDCRGIMNPGRFEEYKQLTGKDAPVINYLSNNTLMPQFLNSIFNTIDITVNNYLQRGFESLQISFGCTGGQHRSVYAAEQMKKYLKSKFNLEAIIIHLEQEDNNITRR
jgi:RNase adaptor protein for sRNA GlmZ degradation